jgi:hypothetical protein
MRSNNITRRAVAISSIYRVRYKNTVLEAKPYQVSVKYLLFVVRCSLSVVRCPLFVVRCLLSIIVHCLFGLIASIYATTTDRFMKLLTFRVVMTEIIARDALPRDIRC